ncbi:hypothetical protein [Treponema sp.]|uniref:hypothetical protein n=1 Tax=Treponema sp. TaxID=166 RepID=UPI003F0FB54A
MMLEELYKSLDEINHKLEQYNKTSLESCPAAEYNFGFLVGEFNLQNPSIISVIEILKSCKDADFMKYTAAALNYYFKDKIRESKNRLDKFNNDIRCTKQLEEWNETTSCYYNSLVNTENDTITEIRKLLSSTKLTDYLEYFASFAERNCIYTNLANWIQDADFFRANYGYFCIFEALFWFYSFEQTNLREFKPKETALFEYFSQHNVDILEDNNYNTYGLITFTDNYEPIFTEHLECRLFNKKLNITIPLSNRLDNDLFKELFELRVKSLIKTISFRPYYDTPITGRFTTDIALEAVQFGQIFDMSNLNGLVPTKLIDENSDTLWIKPVGNEITFEELEYDFNTFNDYIITQAVHLEFFVNNGSFFIKHLDHEIIFYTFDEYDKRQSDIKQKEKAQKRQKTFKIDDSAIPFLENDRPAFLIKVLYTYFSSKELLNEYFSKCNA